MKRLDEKQSAYVVPIGKKPEEFPLTFKGIFTSKHHI